MVLLLCPNVQQHASVEVTNRIAKHLSALGVHCVADESLQSALQTDSAITFLPQQVADETCHLIAAIGGDGNMLRVSQRAIAIHKPIFGINTGRVGFLSAFDSKSIDDISVSAIENLSKSNRLLLDLSLKSAPEQHYYAVNDVVLSKNATSNTIEVDIEYGRHQFGRIRADGVIVSTPTGSTAYSLSAGGPIVAPGVNAFVITPICAHTLVSRAFVLGSADTVMISLTAREENLAYISVDGVNIGKIDSTDVAVLKPGEKFLQLLVSEKRSFYGILSREISEKD